jgi:hypothetical protein
MGREVKRVPLNFDFPLNESYDDYAHKIWYDQHRQTCPKDADTCQDECSSGGCDPPTGEGWQLWQTVSDGPITPVFSTPEELIDYLCRPIDRLVHPEDWYQGGADDGWDRHVAEVFVRKCGWAPSGAILDGIFLSGAEAMVRLHEEKATEVPSGSESPLSASRRLEP